MLTITYKPIMLCVIVLNVVMLSVIILKNIMLSFKASPVLLVKEMRLFLKQLEIEFSLKLFDLNLVNFVRQKKFQLKREQSCMGFVGK
jgi:hypothetical protein